MNVFTFAKKSFFSDDTLLKGAMEALTNICPSFAINKHLFPEYQKDSTFWGLSADGLVCGKVTFEKMSQQNLEDLLLEFRRLEKRFRANLYFFVFTPGIESGVDTCSIFGPDGPRARFFEYFAVQDSGQEALGVMELETRRSGNAILRGPAVRGVVRVESTDGEVDTASEFFRAASLSRDELESFFELSIEVKKEMMKASPSQPESFQTAI